MVNNDVAGVLLSYIMQQKAKVRAIASGEVYTEVDPRFDLVYRHESDKLYMLESLAEDAGLKIQRSIKFGEG